MAVTGSNFSLIRLIIVTLLLTIISKCDCSWWKVMNHMGLSIPGNAYMEVKCGKKANYKDHAFKTDSSYKFEFDISKLINQAKKILEDEVTPRIFSHPVDQRHQLYQQLGGILKRAGYGAGSACVERVICEVQQNRRTLVNYGLVGEFLKLVFTPSLSPYAQTNLLQYLVAESKGHRRECHLWGNKCPFSLFKLQKSFNLFTG